MVETAGAKFTIGDQFNIIGHDTIYEIDDINLEKDEYDIKIVNKPINGIFSCYCDIIDNLCDAYIIKHHDNNQPDEEQHKMTLQEQLNITTEDNFAKQKEIDEGNRHIKMHLETIHELTEENMKLKTLLKHRDKLNKLDTILQNLGLYIGAENNAEIYVITEDNKIIGELNNRLDTVEVEDCRIDED